MEQIHEREGISIDQQRLVSKCNRMFEDDLVCWFLTEEDSVIHLVLRLGGGARTKQSSPARRPTHVVRLPSNIKVGRQRLLQDCKCKWTPISSPSYPPSYWHSYIKDNCCLSSSNHRDLFFHQNNSVLVSLPDDLFFPLLLLLTSLCHPDCNSDLTDLYQVVRSGTSPLVQNILH
jgi:hypothetical protein